MAELEIQTMKKVIENIPDDYKIQYIDNKDIVHILTDKIEINVSDKTVTLKSD